MSITADEAKSVIAAALAKSTDLGRAVTITVVDTAGHVVAIHRQDGSGPINFDLSYGFAFTSAITGGATGERLAQVADLNWFRAASTIHGGKLMAAKGAMPINRGDVYVGSIGVSGAPEEEDHAIAEAGANALN